jgi:hypothetical protein
VLIGARTSNLPACSIAHQQPTLPHSPALGNVLNDLLLKNIQDYETSTLNTGCSIKLKIAEQMEEGKLVDKEDDGKTVFQMEQMMIRMMMMMMMMMMTRLLEYYAITALTIYVRHHNTVGVIM